MSNLSLRHASPDQIALVCNVVKALGLSSYITGDLIAVDRDSMCEANPRKDFSPSSIPEEWAYPRTLEVVQSLVPAHFRLMWGGKTDDVLYLEVYVKASAFS